MKKDMKKHEQHGPHQTPQWTSVLQKGKHYLPLIRHSPCYSYSQYMLDTTMHKYNKTVALLQTNEE